MEQLARCAVESKGGSELHSQAVFCHSSFQHCSCVTKCSTMRDWIMGRLSQCLQHYPLCMRLSCRLWQQAFRAVQFVTTRLPSDVVGLQSFEAYWNLYAICVSFDNNCSTFLELHSWKKKKIVSNGRNIYCCKQVPSQVTFPKHWIDLMCS